MPTDSPSWFCRRPAGTRTQAERLDPLAFSRISGRTGCGCRTHGPGVPGRGLRVATGPDHFRGPNHGTIEGVITVLFYLVIAAVIGLVIFFLAVLVFGRGEQMAPLDPRTSPAELPESDVTSHDVRNIRFALALRGYRMSDVDWTLERLGDQIDELRRENAALRGLGAPPEQPEMVELLGDDKVTAGSQDESR